jgi:hypothetical protein
MNKRGVWVATLSVLFLLIFMFSVSMLKGKRFEESRVVESGEIPSANIGFAIEEAKRGFILDKMMEVVSFKALNELGESGGVLDPGCEKIKGHVIWKDECLFSEDLQESFFGRFQIRFGEYLSEYGWGLEVNKILGEKMVLRTSGLMVLESKGSRYGFEPRKEHILEYDFEDYRTLWIRARACVEEEDLEGVFRNDLFEDCRKDKDFKWRFEVVDEYVVIDVSKEYGSLGNVVIKFALPKDNRVVA